VDIISNIKFNEPTIGFNCPIVGYVLVKCLLKHRIPKDNIELIATTLTPSIDEDSLRGCLTLVDCLVIANAIRNHIQQINPSVDVMSNDEFTKFKDTIIRQLKANRFECSKFNLAETVSEFYGMPVVELSDARVFAFIEAKKINKN
jgi:hypothetical protein